ncbi:MAG: glycoside hydrolase family 3 N-terminal domain-containing protein [Balneolaceae bacterium]|jgi:beta-glucosidase
MESNVTFGKGFLGATKWAFICIFFVLSTAKAFSQTAPQLGKDPIQDVIGAMTLQEKAKIVVGMGWDASKIEGAAGQTYPIPRLGIPSMVLADGPAGLRIQPIRGKDSSQTYYATAFPVARLLASSWDTSLVEAVGKAFGNEVHEYGVDILLAPALNIHRNPLGGRNFEYYSEDPLVSGKMAAAMVRGVESEGVGTSIKHFVANNQESNRMKVNTIASERALREIYLKGFEIAVKESQPWTVMSSYNKLNGTYTSQRRDLLTTVLRDEWGFNGLVVTDWTGGDNSVEQMKAGNDLIMPGNEDKIKNITDAVESGALDEKVLDRNVERILNIVLNSPSFKGYKYSNSPDLQAHAKLARKAAAESMILLKNGEQTLPLAPNTTLAAFGNTSYDIIIGGTGSGDVNEAYSVQLTQGLTDAGYTLDSDLQSSYNKYIKEAKAKQPKPKNLLEQVEPIPEMQVEATTIRQKADADDAAIVTIGRNAGEGADRNQSDFYLSDEEKALLKNVSEAFHSQGKKVIVILNIDGIIDVSGWRDMADAILLAWQPGQEAGHAIADLLSGAMNPSGKLATTIPETYADVPSSEYFPGTPEKKPEEVIYREGIYNGYRYYDTFDVKPAYEFGYGLSYTTFSIGDLQVPSSVFNGKMTVKTRITNTGEVPGREVVQLYLSAPDQTLDKPAQELKKFAKTSLLKPGESQLVTFDIAPGDLASFNSQTSSWEAEAGTYSVKVGASSRDIRQTASFDLKEMLTVEKDHKVLQPEKPVNEIKP